VEIIGMMKGRFWRKINFWGETFYPENPFDSYYFEKNFACSRNLNLSE
jgi:hypothetical protein